MKISAAAHRAFDRSSLATSSEAEAESLDIAIDVVENLPRSEEAEPYFPMGWDSAGGPEDLEDMDTEVDGAPIMDDITSEDGEFFL